ncbi:MAG: acyltransferase family protein [Cyanobacteria bacterium J06621_11]
MSIYQPPHLPTEQPNIPPEIVDRPRFRADIEGLRAIAILLVLAYHAKVPGFEGGYIGVDIFFVLSGYLITWLLINEAQKTGTINLTRFYARRARRLLPALLVVLVAIVGISTFIYAPFEQLSFARTALATASYLSNAYFAYTAVDYLGAASETNPLLHTWTLSLEEQFYLVWPIFVMLASGVLHWRKPVSQNSAHLPTQKALSRRRIVSWMIGVTILSFLLSLHLTQTKQAWAFFLAPSRTWELSLGALGILIPIQTSKNREFIGWIGLGGIIASNLLFNATIPFPGFAALIPAISTLLVLRTCASRSQSWLAHCLGWKVFKNIGRVSYSWYLWHWPVLVFALAIWPDLSLLVRVGLVALGWVIAEISYHCLEKPIRHNSFLAQKSARSITVGILITVFSVFLSVGWIQKATAQAYSPAQIQYTRAKNDVPIIYQNGCHADFQSEAPKIDGCTVPDTADNQPTERPSVILVGDSHAAQWYAPFSQLAEANGWALTSMTKNACPYADVLKFEPALGREYSECSKWRQKTLEYIEASQPDMVVVAYWTKQPFSREEWIGGTERIMEKLSAASKHVIALKDTPSIEVDAPVCLARKSSWLFAKFSNTPCEMSKQIAKDGSAEQMAYEAFLLATEKYSNVSVIDMNDYVCDRNTCNLQQDDLILYRDSHHLTETFALTLAQPLYEQITKAIQASIPEAEAVRL